MPVSALLDTVKLVETVVLPGVPVADKSEPLAQPGTPELGCVQDVTLGAAKLMVAWL